jgi:TP901-1 family phage major tail protein
MAGFNGRALTIDESSTTLVGIRTRGFSITNDHVDVTTDDDNGWRTLLADPGLRSVEVTLSGITSDEVLLAEIMAATVAEATIDINLPTGTAGGITTPGKLAGSFFVSSYEQTGEHDDAVEFSATFMSDGAIVYTASA